MSASFPVHATVTARIHYALQKHFYTEFSEWYDNTESGLHTTTTGATITVC